MLKTKLHDKDDMLNQSKPCKCHLLQQEREEKEHSQQQLQKYKHLYQQEAEQVEKLKAYILSPTCPTGGRYQMNQHPHGIAVIIVNHTFYSTTPTSKLLPNSRGRAGDTKNLCATWEHLGYHVRVLYNLPVSDLIGTLEQISCESHEDYDSFVCCIVSRGYIDGVYGADGEIVKVDDIVNVFRCTPTLTGKPKMFFTYTCCESDMNAEVAAVASQYETAKTSCNDLDYFVCSINMPWRKRSKYIATFHKVTMKYAARGHLRNLLTITDFKMLELDAEHQPVSIIMPLHKELWFL